ncbi:Cyclin, C-terminal domain,Cyclin-like,Cyclin, N-terminal [Cinara cedri]|uniref:Cyclin, C-terminal domain,Cyclin-like,Cyclin, N-terminal n=1 Tax=Cinara cedri TaxID=506608 RepID=A0A5E4MDG1_9HEMI|nr:Cyclin, C-terminal domain,Cyclin-like,Cyclin, N-terminal [Cinara cedri]
MDLLCCESTSKSVAQKDPTLLHDDRVFNTMLQSEKRCLPAADYLTTVQSDLTPNLRKIVVDWMWEVCEEQKCQEDIFPLAVNYLDRFLSKNPIQKNHLQLLGTTCLLVSSKLRECESLTVDLLILYTDNTVSSEDLLMWELLLLSILKWDVSALTAHDFLWYILKRLNLDTVKPFVDIVVKHCGTFIGMCVRDYKFCSYLPSVIAGASIAAALNGLEYAAIHKYDLFTKLHVITGAKKETLKACQEQIEAIVESHKRQRKEQMDFALYEEKPVYEKTVESIDPKCWI